MASTSASTAAAKRRLTAAEKAASSGAEEQLVMPCPSTPERPRRPSAAHKMQSPSGLMSPPSKGQHSSFNMGFLSPLPSHGVLSPTTPKSDYYHYALGLSPFQILPSDSPSMRPFSPQRVEPPTLDKFCWSPASPRQNMHDEFALAAFQSPTQTRGKKDVKSLDFVDVVGTPSKRARSDSDTASIFSNSTPYDANAKALFDRLNDSRGGDSPRSSRLDAGDSLCSPPHGIHIPFPAVDDLDPGDPFNTEQASAALLSLSTSPIRSPAPRKSQGRAKKPSGRALETQFASPASTPSTARAKQRSQRNTGRGKAAADTPAEKIKKAHATPVQSPKKKSKIGSNGKASVTKAVNENEEALGLLEAASGVPEKLVNGSASGSSRHATPARSNLHSRLESPKRFLSPTPSSSAAAAATAAAAAAAAASTPGGSAMAGASASKSTTLVDAPESPSKAKPVGCNCKKSKCLKLYCECFQQQKYCQHCNCRECHNRVQFAELRQQAIDSILERNPLAFEPKIKDSTSGSRHINGCHCKKSACLKKYCECFQAGVACADKCRCVECQNTVGGRIFDVKTPEPRKPTRAPTQTIVNSKTSAPPPTTRLARVSPVSLNETALAKEAANLRDALKDPAMVELALVTLLSSATTPQQQAEALAGLNIDPVAALELLKTNFASAQLLFGLSQSAVAAAAAAATATATATATGAIAAPVAVAARPQAAVKRFQRPGAASIYGVDARRVVKSAFGPNAGPTFALRPTAVTLSFLDDVSLGRLGMASRRGRDSLLECGFQQALSV